MGKGQLRGKGRRNGGRAKGRRGRGEESESGVGVSGAFAEEDHASHLISARDEMRCEANPKAYTPTSRSSDVRIRCSRSSEAPTLVFS